MRSPSGCRSASTRRCATTSTSVLLVVNARERIGAGDKFVARRVFGLGAPVVIALNKIDRLKHAQVAEQMKTAAALGDFHALHPVSAKTGDGIDELRDDLISLLPEGPLYYPAGEVTDMPLEVRIAELVREQALRLTKEEVPHAVTAEVVEIDERRVHVRVYTETESQKQILIGKGGTMVREIGRSGAARDRGAARPDDLPPAPGQGRAEVAAQRDDARAARDVAARARAALTGARLEHEVRDVLDLLGLSVPA